MADSSAFGRITEEGLAELRGPNLVGDTTWCKGKVIGKSVEDGQHLVECELWGENQKGEVTTRGNAVVMLPFAGSSRRC